MATTGNGSSPEWQRVKGFYDRELRAKLEPAENGKYIVIDEESHDYEVDSSRVVATVHLRDRRPDARLVAFSIGYDTKGSWRLKRNHPQAGTAAGDLDNARQEKKTVALPPDSRRPASLRAEAFYDAELRAKLEPRHRGKYIVIAGESHDYEVGGDLIAAAVHLLDRQPDAEMFMFRIGYDGEQYALHGLPLFI